MEVPACGGRFGIEPLRGLQTLCFSLFILHSQKFLIPHY